jgi:hypothetical protein
MEDDPGAVVMHAQRFRIRPFSGDGSMKRNAWIRQFHRWTSIVFTLTVIANLVAMGLGKPPAWVVYAPLPPLFLLMLTGLYMFVLPYAAKQRAGRGAGGQA